MQPVPQDLLKQYVQSQKFTSTAEIMSAMKEMFRDVIQTVMDEELGRERCQRSDEPEGTPRNYRNGYTKKTVKTQLGEVNVKVPRDRNGTFEPRIIGKYSRNADGMEDKILALYACGMSQRDIAEQIKELYDVEISPELVTKISEKIMPEVTAWQNRPLESVYPFIFMDAIHYKVKEDHRYVTKAAYVVLGITMDGRKDILGVWIGEHESSKFWLNVLNDLKSWDIRLRFSSKAIALSLIRGCMAAPTSIAHLRPICLRITQNISSGTENGSFAGLSRSASIPQLWFCHFLT